MTFWAGASGLMCQGDGWVAITAMHGLPNIFSGLIAVRASPTTYACGEGFGTATSDCPCSQLTGLHRHAINDIDHRRLKALHGGFSAQDVHRLVMDEFALHKGYRYPTVVMDAERMRVLWVGEGNSREAMRPSCWKSNAASALKLSPWI